MAVELSEIQNRASMNPIELNDDPLSAQELLKGDSTANNSNTIQRQELDFDYLEKVSSKGFSVPDTSSSPPPGVDAVLIMIDDSTRGRFALFSIA